MQIKFPDVCFLKTWSFIVSIVTNKSISNFITFLKGLIEINTILSRFKLGSHDRWRYVMNSWWLVVNPFNRNSPLQIEKATDDYSILFDMHIANRILHKLLKDVNLFLIKSKFFHNLIHCIAIEFLDMFISMEFP